ncbi:alanine--tRNA ligase [Lihuaxuella thermophila]|uniref:Alanine--tRNA ligase n=1 Tax=Lihuaxuella thermophila TaxID=1173111 RepID=A0A1H8ARE5_9BACL|nr:alanine--tRNA ligase [Lihuaxuella thermophila]SEM73292.1 alanyl-tRNA synthetase [Lihuaxuella thermophila]
MKAYEIRRKFLDFFVEKGHKVEPSASLVPVDDPSLLWINSGVATLKKYFDGRLTPENPRIANSQKSIRTNDIENVGYTARHHTFFEMLGNFSIGDYFKEEAITWAWEFLTSPKWMGLAPEKLSVTIHPEDDEAYRIWHEKIGIPDERIVRLEDNFWDIGEGPCGPNSEIFYDRGEAFGDLSDPECYPGGENERFLEIWNLVFSQYNHNPDGSYTPLPRKNIDTGMGLERMASVMQNVPTNYDTDLFQPIIQATCEKAGVEYGKDQETDIALKVIADHIRTIVFAVGDGVLPSNEGRGYVLRRLLRRAVRYGRKLGMERPFLYELTGIVAEIMKDYYPEPVDKKDFIERVIRGEEERFLETLTEGLKILEEMVNEAKEVGKKEISGEEAFKLYDTYGFPIDLTEDFAREHGLAVDREGFEQEMATQRERARAARQDVDSMKVQGGALANLEVKSQFVGYTELEKETRIAAIIYEDQLVDILGAGKKGLVILEETPFYAESGGQVADRGTITTHTAKLRVEDVQKGPRGEHVHTVVVESGSIRQGDTAFASVDHSLRSETVKNHTATHLLHKALKEVLGEHVNQAGSLVAPDRLRFDFTHIGAMTDEELREVEKRVNEQVWVNTKVETMIKPLAEAKAMGAMALFGEKYGEVVRVVRVGDYSLELCGGTHVNSTGEIGLFKIMSESGIGSGIRRIEAATGRRAFAFLEQQVEWLKAAAGLLKTNPQEVAERIAGLQEKMRELSRENESLRAKLNQRAASELLERVREVSGVPVLSVQVEAKDMEQLRSMMDDLRQKLQEGVIVLGAVSGEKVQFVASVSPKYVQAGLHAGKLIKEVASICGGGGGGRPDMAQAGGKQPDRLPAALERVFEWLPTQL